MAQRAVLHATARTVLGKKVKHLRREGILPGNVFGRGLDSLAIQLDAREFTRTVREAGIRTMFELAVAGEGAPRYVIVRGLSRQGGMGEPLHVDLYQVDLNRPIQTNVRIHLVGEAPAVRDLAGTVVHGMETVAVHCLPLSIPDYIEADVSVLKSFDAALTVGSLKAPAGVEILGDPAVIVASVVPPRIRLEAGEDGD